MTANCGVTCLPETNKCMSIFRSNGNTGVVIKEHVISNTMFDASVFFQNTVMSLPRELCFKHSYYDSQQQDKQIAVHRYTAARQYTTAYEY